MAYYKKIIGKRLYLSPINIEDADTYCRWINDFSTSLPLGNAAMNIGLDQERAFLKDLSTGNHFAIIDKETDKLLGNVSLFEVNQIHRTATTGIFIGEPENRNKGYGREALSLMLDYAFNVLNLNNVMLRVFAFNQRGLASYKAVGFKEIGVRRQAYFAGGKYFDEYFMDILAAEFSNSCLRAQFSDITGELL